ncbi:amino acid permease [Microbacteriaceae bacterium VKM Ac-2854]|nr:amino acid permease [Microbacteriaceae bacterium VKM Ac-2854]
MTADARLARRLGTFDAVVIGLGSMIGAGIFAVFAPAAAAAGPWLIVGLAAAAAVAFCNATSSAQLAAQYPESGGTYVYGRERLGEWPGFLAGWCFVIGKSASCAAMALTFASYAAPAEWHKPLAIAAVVLLAVLNGFGVTRTAALARMLVVIVLAVLGLVAVGGTIAAGSGSTPFTAPFAAPETVTAYGVLQSAGLLFFAFAGYARIATMGEEVRDPARTIPRAIVIALSIALVVYLAIAVVTLSALGPVALGESTAPLVDVLRASGWTWAVPVVGVGAAAASLGALLALVAGIGRTTLAMARTGDLPRFLAAVHPRYRVPRRAELALAVAVSLVILAVDVRAAIGFSSFGVLLYYAVANVAALTQTSEHRRYPRIVGAAGVLGCAVLVATLPPTSIVAGLVTVAIGVGYRVIVRRADSVR